MLLRWKRMLLRVVLRCFGFVSHSLHSKCLLRRSYLQIVWGTATLEVVSQAFLAEDVWGLRICGNNGATADQFQVDGALLHLCERRGSNLLSPALVFLGLH